MTRRSVVLAFAIGALGAVIGGGAVVWADHQFSDVPDTGFHDQIGNIVDAGCATGFADGTFRPGNNVTRGQAAAWLNRCGGRAQHASGQDSFMDDAEDVKNLAGVGMRAGAEGVGEGLVVVIGTGTIDTAADGNVIWQLHADDGTNEEVLVTRNDSIPEPLNGPTINIASSVTLLSVVEIEPGENIDFFLSVERADGMPLANIRSDIVAMSFPFNGQGGAGFGLD